ncbi:MAG: SDR family NAD(P)-dependent oxidoreductase, partial [Okeania sp. SIO2D1]|nr:SDR family NAD(P)-dependent oxidoreductase [Okeania sp. SIO2D1]
MQLKGKTALVTGASRGIGRAIVLELAQKGVARLLVIARDRQRLAELIAEAQALNPEVQVIPLAVDLSQTSAASIAISQAWRAYGPIHLLVNNAGVAHQTPFLESQPRQVEAEINVNLVGMYTITRLIARRMATRGDGIIINVSSLMGKLAAPTFATYSATKFAILGFTQALRAELAPRNVRVIALLPSLTETDMVRHTKRFRWVLPTTPETVAKALSKGLEQGSNEIFVNWQSKVTAVLTSIFP